MSFDFTSQSLSNEIGKVISTSSSAVDKLVQAGEVAINAAKSATDEFSSKLEKSAPVCDLCNVTMERKDDMSNPFINLWVCPQQPAHRTTLQTNLGLIRDSAVPAIAVVTLAKFGTQAVQAGAEAASEAAPTVVSAIVEGISGAF